MGIDRAYLNINKDHIRETYSEEHTQWAKTKSFPPRSGTRQGYPLSPLLFNTVLEVLDTAIRQEKGNKRHPNYQKTTRPNK